jgi:hypothetical protein
MSEIKKEKIRVFANPIRLCDYIRNDVVINKTAAYGLVVGCHIDGDIYIVVSVDVDSIKPYSAEINLTTPINQRATIFDRFSTLRICKDEY